MRTATRQKLVQAVVPAYLAACLILGGASAAGFAANMLLQLAALFILYFALRRSGQAHTESAGKGVLWLCVLFVATFVIQLIPLPPAIWTRLPHRDMIVRGYDLLGVPLPWLPVSLSPDKTLASLLWLLPALAVLLGILRLGAFRLVWIAWLLAGASIVSTMLGAVQLLDGAGSRAYFYHFTNFGQAVGFFANANHLATLLLVAAPFLAALLAESRGSRNRHSASAISITLGAVLLVVLVGLTISGSLAGVGIAVPVGLLSYLIVRAGGARVPTWAIAGVAVLALGAVALVMSQPANNNLTSAGARDDSLSRYTSFSTTIKAAGDYFPVGSGIGSFVDVYRQYEDPRRTIPTYMNHAHSDFLEILLETGLIGILLVALFLFWWSRRAWAIWTADEPNPFLRAATIASGAIMAHSLVDYPLRTAAISALFAASVAIMTDPRERTIRRKLLGSDTGARHLEA